MIAVGHVSFLEQRAIDSETTTKGQWKDGSDSFDARSEPKVGKLVADEDVRSDMFSAAVIAAE